MRSLPAVLAFLATSTLARPLPLPSTTRDKVALKPAFTASNLQVRHPNAKKRDGDDDENGDCDDVEGSLLGATNCNSPGGSSLNIDVPVEIDASDLLGLGKRVAEGGKEDEEDEDEDEEEEGEEEDDWECENVEGGLLGPTNCNSPGGNSVNVNVPVDVDLDDLLDLEKRAASGCEGGL